MVLYFVCHVPVRQYVFKVTPVPNKFGFESLAGEGQTIICAFIAPGGNMLEEGARAARMAELVPVLVGETGAFIIVIAWRALGIADQHALPGQDEIDPGFLRRSVRLYGLQALTLAMADNGRDRIGVIDNIVRHV